MGTLTIIGYIVLAVYCLALVYITVFCLMQAHLLYNFRRFIRSRREKLPDVPSGPVEWPVVTVQLPIYNERFVVERLIDNIVQLDYPADRLEVQVLDDSTDDTRELARKKVDFYRELGIDIKYVSRPERTGYKAGALQYGMQTARGEYIAIFDADFLPRRDFLRRTIPSFTDDAVAAVQTRWEHINRDYSLITKLQAFQLNVHFSVEQAGREAGDLLLQFNGTAGIWRRDAIVDAGGWQADTLTEDLDLSYRAQLRGWKIRYLYEIASPGELPAEMNGFKSQQYRWMKGGAETARKLLPRVWSSGIPLSKKMHATMHLLSSTVFLFVFLIGVFSVPLLFVLDPLNINTHYFTIFLAGWVAIAVVFFVANANTDWSSESTFARAAKFALLFPLFLALSMGLSFHNSIAVIHGYRGRRTAFIRTPKFNIRSFSDKVAANYLPGRISATTIVEGLLALYFTAALVAAFIVGDATFFIFHLLLAIGYGAICYFSIRHYRM